jgi:hypothetical protein
MVAVPSPLRNAARTIDVVPGASAAPIVVQGPEFLESSLVPPLFRF